MKRKKTRVLLGTGVLLVLLFTAACGGRDNTFVTGQQYYQGKETPETEAKMQTEAQEQKPQQSAAQTESFGADVFLITDNNMKEECIILEQIASGKQYMYYYSVTTRFLDKYGNRATVSEFTPGRVITVGKKDIDGRLMEAQISDAVWEYPDVTRYAVDEERGIFTIADTNYSYDADVLVYSDGSRIQMSELTALDTLRVVGTGKKILSVAVTTGHGTLKLANTALFEGSFIQIGSKIFSEITENMQMELPEGSYTVTVANKGYGGSTEVEIKRGVETLLDLDTLKGEGPKTGEILFAVDVAGAIIQIDGEVVDYSQAVPLTYGVHTLTVTADSYDTYRKKLFVNSEKATIVIGLSGEDVVGTGGAASGETTEGEADETDGETENESEVSAGAGGLAGSLAGSHSTDTAGGNAAGGSVGEAELDALVNSLLEEKEDGQKADYLSTLTELLESLAESDR